MKPTAEFEQHHEVEAPRVDQYAFRQAWRVRTRLDRLLLESAISPEEYMAAVRFRITWQRAFVNLWPPPIDRGMGVQPATYTRADLALARRFEALAQMRELRRLLGDVIIDLVELCTIEDLSWAALGRRLKVDPKTARAWTITALKSLVVKI